MKAQDLPRVGTRRAGEMWVPPLPGASEGFPVLAFLSSTQRAASLPGAAVSLGGWWGPWVRCRAKAGALLEAFLSSWQRASSWSPDLHAFLLCQHALVSDHLRHPCCSSQRLKSRLGDMWASGLTSLGIGEGVSVQGSWPTPVINAILFGTRRGILWFHWKLSPPRSCSAQEFQGAGTMGREVGRGPLVKELRSCYWGWGEIGCGPRAQHFLAPHPRALALLTAVRTWGPVFNPHQPGKWCQDQLWQSVFKWDKV